MKSNPKIDIDSLALIQAGLDHLDEGISLYDRELCLVAWNKSFTQLQEFPEEMLYVGMPITELIRYNVERDVYGEGDAEELIAERIALLRPRWRTNFQRTRSDGGIVDIHWYPLDDGGFAITYRDITEQTKALEVLRKSEGKLSRTQQMAHLGSCEWHLESGQMVWSEEIYNIFGVKLDEHNPTEEALYEAIHPDDREFVGKTFENVIESGDPFTLEHRVVRPSGEVRTLHAEGEVAFDGDGKPEYLICAVQDITYRTEMQNAVRESQSRFELIADNLPVLIAYIDTEDNMRFANKTFEDWYGLSRDDLIGGPRYLAADKERNHIQLERWQRVWAGERLEFKEKRKFANREGVSELDCLMVPHRDENGKVLGGVLLSIDETDRNDTERVLRQAQKMEAVGQLTGGVAHDFNNLLAIVMGNIGLAKSMVMDNPKAPALLDEALRASRRGAKLIEHLLSFSRQKVLQTEFVELDKLLTGMSNLLQVSLGEMIDVKIKVQPDIWLIEVDVNEMESALLNLAVNARDAMDRRGTLIISAENLSAEEGSLEKDQVVITVTDTGKGMSDEVLEHVFEPFFSTKDVGEGSGLGLAMIYGFVTQSNGEVKLSSKEGVGTEARLCFPKAVERRREDTKSEDNIVGVEGRQAGRLLVVEDNEDLRKITLMYLNEIGYSCTDVADGVAALEVLADGEMFDLMLSDIILPKGISGVDLANEVYKNYPDMKVLLTSGYPRDELMKLGDEKDILTVLRKPYTPEELVHAVNDRLKGSHTRRTDNIG